MFLKLKLMSTTRAGHFIFILDDKINQTIQVGKNNSLLAGRIPGIGRPTFSST